MAYFNQYPIPARQHTSHRGCTVGWISYATVRQADHASIPPAAWEQSETADFSTALPAGSEPSAWYWEAGRTIHRGCRGRCASEASAGGLKRRPQTHRTIHPGARWDTPAPWGSYWPGRQPSAAPGPCWPGLAAAWASHDTGRCSASWGPETSLGSSHPRAMRSAGILDKDRASFTSLWYQGAKPSTRRGREDPPRSTDPQRLDH